MKPLIPNSETTLKLQVLNVLLKKTNSINLDNFSSNPPTKDFKVSLYHIGMTDAREIESLSLGYNNIESIHHNIQRLPKLKHLSLNDNNFKNIPDVLETLPKLSTVNLKGNPLSLETLLKISASEKIMYALDEGHMATLNQIKNSPEDKKIAEAFVKEYPDISAEEFNTLLPVVKAQVELQEINKFELPKGETKLSFAIREVKSKVSKSKQQKPSIFDGFSKAAAYTFENLEAMMNSTTKEIKEDSSEISSLTTGLISNQDKTITTTNTEESDAETIQSGYTPPPLDTERFKTPQKSDKGKQPIPRPEKTTPKSNTRRL